ncbi:MAG: hypothetical protein J6O41_00075 [Clostridia bacterium]|nr:hypothetical protein [Clostridia bacterium]
MKENYPKAYTEVLEILKYMPIDDVKKIPKELIDTFEYKKDNNYKFIISEDQDFSKLKILDETEAIMVNIFEDYWATPEQKAKIQAKMREDMRIIEEEKKAKYNVDIFKKKENAEIENDVLKTNINNLLIEVKKEKFYERVIRFIKKVLKID